MSYLRGTGYDNLTSCGTDCQKCGDKWHKKCQLGYVPSSTCSVCIRPNTTTSSSKVNIWTYIFIVIVIISIIVFFYRLFTVNSVTRNTVPDLALGTPGINDPYGALETMVDPSPVYYI